MKNKEKKIDKKAVDFSFDDASGDAELQDIIQKYSKKHLNPFKNKKNEQLKAEEIASLLRRREEERLLEEQRIKEQQRQERIDTAKGFVKKHKAILTALMVVFLGLCTGKYHLDQQKRKVQNVSFVFSENEEKYIGDNLDLSFVVEPNTAKYKGDEITVVFSDNNMVSPTKAGGLYTCETEGNLIVKLYYKGTEFDSKTINIKPVLINKLFLPDIQVGKGNTLIIDEPTIEPENATNKDYYMSIEDTDIATLNDHSITGVELGKTILHLKSVDGFSYDVNVSVIDIMADSISLNLKEITLLANEGTHQLTVNYHPIETTVKDIVFSSSNRNVARVDENGLITAKNAGEAIITAKYNDDASAEIRVIVVYPPAESISLTTNYSTIYVGNRAQIHYSIKPYYNNNKKVTFYSDDKSVATVDDDGVVTAVSVGTVVIKAKTENGKEDSIEISVVEKPVARLSSSSGSGGSGGGSSGNYATSGSMVYIASSGKGKCYHSNPNCSNMKNPNCISLEDAINRGYVACSKCY